MRFSFCPVYLKQLFTRTVWWVVPLVWLPVVCGFVTMSVQMGLTPSQAALALVGGIFVWTLLEYTLHRFLFHMKTTSYWFVLWSLFPMERGIHAVIISLSLFVSPCLIETFFRGNTLHYLLHGCHHKHPMDGLRLVFPPVATAILCVPVCLSRY